MLKSGKLPFLITESSENIGNFLQEGIELSTTGKLFLAGLSAWIVGRAAKLRIRGTEEEVKAIAGALLSSRKFQDELSKPGASVKDVINSLNIKNLKGREFEKALGIPWPL